MKQSYIAKAAELIATLESLEKDKRSVARTAGQSYPGVAVDFPDRNNHGDGTRIFLNTDGAIEYMQSVVNVWLNNEIERVRSALAEMGVEIDAKGEHPVAVFSRHI